MTAGAAGATRGWSPLLLPCCCLVVVYALLWLVVALVAGILVGGLEPVVLTSGSMEPGAARGDVVLVERYDGGSLAAGTVVTFEDPVTPERLVTHRIDSVLPDGRYRTRGDANAAPDSAPIPASAVVGVGRVLVPFVALPVVWLQGGDLHLVGGLVLVVVVAALGAHGDPPSPRRRRRWPRRRGRPVRTIPRAAAVVLVLTVVLAVGSAARASATFSASFSAACSTAGSWSAATVAAPSEVTASFSCGLLGLGKGTTVSWSGVAGADRYEVWRAIGTGTPSIVATVAGSTTSYIDTAVQNRTTYHYTVRTVSAGWVSAFSAGVSVTTPGALSCPL